VLKKKRGNFPFTLVITETSLATREGNISGGCWNLEKKLRRLMSSEN